MQTKDPSLQTAWQERRRSLRLNSQVKVAVEWANSDGAAHREETSTRVVNWSGCLIALSTDLPLDQPVRLTNLMSQESLDAVVVWRGGPSAAGFDIGLELKKPQNDFWGLDF